MPSVTTVVAMSSRPILVGLAAALLGCASTRVIATKDADQYEGRIVDSLVLSDGSLVTFDPFETAGVGPDTRGRIRGSAVVGVVDGATVRIPLEHVQTLRLGVDDSTKGKATTLLVLVLAVTVVFGFWVLVSFDPAPFR